MDNSIEVQIKLEMQETVDEFIYKAIEPFAETIIGKVSKEEMKQILMQGMRKGRWKYCNLFRTCSVCGYTTGEKDDFNDWIPDHYCPNCGAKMEVDDADSD